MVPRPAPHLRENVFSSAHPTGACAFDFLRAEGLADPAVDCPPAKNPAHRNSRAGFFALNAIFTAIPATAFTIHSKFSRPTDVTSASGAGFMKSIAYGTPSSTANSTVLRSYPKARHKVSASFSTRSFSAADEGGGFPFTYRS